MKLQLKRRPGKWFLSFSVRTVLLISLFLFLVNAGFLLAQSALIDPGLLIRNAIRGADFPFQTDYFVIFRDGAIIPAFGIGLLVFIALSLGHFFAFGAKDMTAEGMGAEDEIAWWNLFERVVHGIIAVSFLILFISGVLITFGRFFGGGVMLRQLHEYAGFVFIPALVITVLMWIREALPKVYDMNWFVHFGGYLGYKGELTSGKFNAGQKMWYWIMAACGVVLAWTGLALFFQIGEMGQLRSYVIIHFFASVPVMLMFVVHLYMTTLGTKGAFMGMIHGRLNKKAAEKYHSDSREVQ